MGKCVIGPGNWENGMERSWNGIGEPGSRCVSCVCVGVCIYISVCALCRDMYLILDVYVMGCQGGRYGRGDSMCKCCRSVEKAH